MDYAGTVVSRVAPMPYQKTLTLYPSHGGTLWPGCKEEYIKTIFDFCAQSNSRGEIRSAQKQQRSRIRSKCYIWGKMIGASTAPASFPIAGQPKRLVRGVLA